MDFYKKIIKSSRLRYQILHCLRFIPDKTMLKIQYRIKLNRKLNLKSPTRYTEKVQWYKLYYRNPLMARCADKFEVRKYVESKGLSYLLNDLIEVYDSPDDISLDNLPDKFIMKLSNGSGTNILCTDKGSLVLDDVIKKFRYHYKQMDASLGREWVYHTDIKPVIIVEKLLEDSANSLGMIRDYKIFCFEGKPKYIICVDGRYTDQYSHVVYDTNWVKQEVRIGHSLNCTQHEIPQALDDMLKYAHILSKDFPFARVDLYNLSGRIYFGEITFFPWSGYMQFYPDSFDYDLGGLFELPLKNN